MKYLHRQPIPTFPTFPKDILSLAIGDQPLGVGIDLVELADFEQLPFDTYRAFYRRCFTPDEIHYCRSQPAPIQHFAARYAAKEAAVKAFSAYIELAYWQIEVRRLDNGLPFLYFWDNEWNRAFDAIEPYHTFVSLTHTSSYAAAIVIVFEKKGRQGEQNDT